MRFQFSPFKLIYTLAITSFVILMSELIENIACWVLFRQNMQNWQSASSNFPLKLPCQGLMGRRRQAWGKTDLFSRFIEKQQRYSFVNTADTGCTRALFHGRVTLSIDVMCGFSNLYTGNSGLSFICKGYS